MHRLKILAILLLSCSLSLVVNAQNKVKIGDKISPFKAVDHNSKVWELDKELKKSEYMVIYFYPAAMTGGCTKQACAFRDSKSSLDSLQVNVVGVSGDEPLGLNAFRQMHQISFTMLSDYSGAIAKLFGVPLRDGGSIEREVNGKKMVLKRGVTTSRWTFVLNKEGKLVYIDTEVDVNTESKKLIDWIKTNK